MAFTCRQMWPYHAGWSARREEDATLELQLPRRDAPGLQVRHFEPGESGAPCSIVTRVGFNSANPALDLVASSRYTLGSCHASLRRPPGQWSRARSSHPSHELQTPSSLTPCYKNDVLTSPELVDVLAAAAPTCDLAEQQQAALEGGDLVLDG